MVLAFTLRLLVSSALLLATVAQVLQCRFPRVRYGRRLSIARSFYKIGDTVSFVCNTGYTLKGSSTSTCQADLRWSPPLPVCKKEVTCPQPPNIANGQHSAKSLDKFSRGLTVYYSCKDGYALVGNVSITCTEAGVWSKTLPRCEAIGCETPKVQNGNVYKPQSTYKAGETLHFDCDAGYAAEDNYEAQCQPGGTWDPPVLTCERIRPCPMPPRVRNGNHNGQGKAAFTMGMSVTYTCDPGYYLVGNAVVFCKASGNWSQPGPHCEEVTCPQPPNIANGQHSAKSLDKFSRGLTVYYSCKDGYALVGNVSITCTEAGVWSKTLPHCEAIGCETPKVQNGKVHGLQSTYKAGETLHFDCDAGYAAEDNYEAQCQPGGTWDPPVLTCERIRPCPMPPRVRNGNHNGQGKAFFTMGMSVTYTCDPGYYLVGNAVVFCKASGNWSQPGPRCEVSVCINPDIENGRQVDGQGLISTPGQAVTFQCDNGFSLQGSAKVFCQEDGSWLPPVPICNRLYHYQELSNRPEFQGGCGAPTRLHFAELNEEHKNEIDFSVGKTVQYTCRPGYAKHPGMSPTITCLESGVWSEALEFCKRKQCNHPGEPVNGKIVSLTDLMFGSTVLYSCEEGHRLIGQSSRRCEIFGGRVAWSGDIPTCQRIPCGPPPDIPNGKHTGRLLDEYHFGISVTYTCNPGYPLHGEPSIYCTTQDGKNGVWSSPLPHCGEARCPVPQVRNGRMVSPPRTAYTHKDTVAFECEPGYVIRGHRVVQCQLNNTWEPPVPVCEQAGCDAPTSLAFAELKEPYSNQTVFPVGRTVEYVCRPGYAQHLGMPPTITCLGNRTWSAALEFCKRKQCANPGDPKNGRAVVLTDLLFESKVNYTCDKGYKLVGGSQRTCEVSGTRVSWSGDAPVCQGIVCDPPPDIPHGRHSGHLMGTFSYADVVTYTCEPGHALAGEPSIFCTTVDGEHGVWSGPPPRCGEVKCPQPPGIANGKHSGQPSDTHLPGSAVQYSCRDGYSLVGNASISCTAEGTWSRPRPRCEAIGCKRPEIENGRVNGLETTYKLADIVIFECNFGYALKGSQESQCQFGGTWDPPVPICEKMLECPSPPNINNGHHDSKDVKVFIPGISVKYYCDPGYVLTGKTTVSCLTSGTWSIPYPRCEVITCMSPNIQNGEVAEGQRAEYHPGANVTFQCHPGYVLWGSRGAKCQPNGRWAPAVPTCKPAGCRAPTTLLFAELSKEYKNQTEFPVGKTVKYTCRPGYIKHPQISPTITCLENRTWSEAREFCKRRKCDHPGEPENGRVIVTTDVFFGSTVNYTCNEGYRLVGASQRHCVISSSGTRVQWTSDVPVCQSIVCDPPPDIPHGRHSGHLMGTFSYADVVTYTCEPGHPLAGEPSIFCTTVDGEHGVWSGPPPRCGVSQCSHPPAVANGNHSGQATVVFTSGMSVSYACNPGYVLVGEAQLNCTSSGDWSNPAPRCEGRLCPSPSAIDHGQHDGEDVKVFIPGTSVNYSCDLGYALIGETTLYCTVNGTWSIPYPRCEVITCMSPNIQNGEVAEGQRAEYHPGANVTFQCHPGYVLWGSRGAKCQPNGRWAPAVPTCKPAGCRAPTTLLFAELSKEYKNQTEFPVGKTVKYTCRPGYIKHPQISPTITCLENRTWSEAREFCKRRKCDHPGEPENGRVIVTTDVFFGSTVNYTCNEGYRLVGASQRHCVISSSGTRVQWTSDVPVCQSIVCDPPPDIPHGRHSGHLMGTFSYADVVTYTCEPGHPLAGEPSIFCTTVDGEHGVWSGPPPRCGVSQCSHPPAVANGNHSGQATVVFTSGMFVSYACNPGYVLVGEAQLNCTSSGDWSNPAPRCEGRLCPSPSAIDHGQHDGEDVKVFIPGTSVNYSCDLGYALIGETTLYCTVNGTWSIPYPRCEVITCMSPNIQNGEVAEGQRAEYHPGANVTFQCHPGYVLWGSRGAKCQPNGRWAPAVPTCKPALPCPPPPVIAHATHSAELGANFTSGMSVSYSCQPGFFLLGDPSVLCTASGNWSLPYPRCTVVQCPSPPNIDKGDHNSHDLEVFSPGMVVNYSCDPGYSLLGEAAIYCTDSGNWSLPLPQCAGGCGAPPNLTFAELTKEYKNLMEFSVGDTVQYRCQPGYMRHPGVTPTLTCLKNHTWSEALAFCKRKQCKYPETPKNGRVVVLTDLLFGSTVSYTCEEGHRLVGRSRRQCEIFGADVAWSGVLPICQKVVCPVPQIQNGRVSVLKYAYTYKDTVIFKCQKGFTLRGNRTAQCQADKTWDPPVPVCEQDGVAEHYHHPDTTVKPVVKCLPPPSIANGEHSSHFSDTFNVGALVHYRCNHGFSLVGTASIYCTESGAWSRPSPVCQVVKCLRPPKITNGNLKGNISDTFSYGASVSYSCNPGYSLVGNAFINCTMLGTWSQPPPRCKEIRCVFPEVQGVKKAIKGNTYRSGTNVTLECDDGYTLEGISQIRCQEDFSWDPPVPACKLMSRKSGSVGLGVAAAGVLLLLGAGIVWKISSKQKEGYYRTYENYQSPLNQVTEQKCSCLP